MTKEGFILSLQFQGVRAQDGWVEVADDRHLLYLLKAHISKSKQSNNSLKMAGVFWDLKAHPSGMPSPARPHFLNFPEQSPTGKPSIHIPETYEEHLLQTITVSFSILSKFISNLQYLLFELYARHSFIFSFFLWVWCSMHICTHVLECTYLLCDIFNHWPVARLEV